MGNYFDRKPLKTPNYQLIDFLKKKKLTQVGEVAETLKCNYPFNFTLNFQEFDDCFGNYLENQNRAFFLQLENSGNIDGEVDIFESLVLLVTFGDGEMEDKLRYIFEIYDFDRSGALEKKELIMTFQTFIRTFCKIVNLRLPSLNDIENFTLALFLSIDKDHTNAIDFEEFKEYIMNNNELQDYFLKYAKLQTFPNARRRHNDTMSLFNGVWLQATNQDKYLSYVPSEALSCQLDKLVPSNELKKLMSLLIETSKFYQNDLKPNYVEKSAYQDVITAFAAFSATDINNDMKIDVYELRYLLYAYEDEVPNYFRVQSELEILDPTKKGYITREEWMQHFSSPDTSGKYIFRGKIKKLFRQYDFDNSGFLEKSELKSLLMEAFETHSKRYNLKNQENVQQFKQMCRELTDDLIQNMQTDNQQNSVSWPEFMEHLEKAYQSMDKFIAFFNTL